MLKRNLDRILFSGQGVQLLWLSFAVIFTFLFFWGVSAVFFKDWDFGWQDIIALYLDSGNFGGSGEHDFFRLAITLVGLFLFSAILISVFTNVFDNISDSVRKGVRRYSLSGHSLILGNSPRIVLMIRRLLEKDEASTVVVMTTSDVESLRDRVEAEIHEPALKRRIVYYFGERNSEDSLNSACVASAEVVYILGEQDEQSHDSLNLKCYELIRNIISKKDNLKLRCFLTFENESSMSVLQYEKSADNLGGRLHLEVLNEKEYDAERLLVYSDFLPAFGSDSAGKSVIVIFGTSEMARAFSFVCTHLSHYPNYRTHGIKTRIIFVGEGMRRFMDETVALKSSLFELSTYEYIGSDGVVEKFCPLVEYGDFLDIEWSFVNAGPASALVRNLLSGIAGDPGCELRIAACQESQNERVESVFDLPQSLRLDTSCQKCIWVEQDGSLIHKAVRTGRFGNIVCFGNVSDLSEDPLFELRAERGMKVNHLYERNFGDVSLSAADAWCNLIPAHKMSSIACANAIPLRLRSFAESKTSLEAFCEVEHRRWMSSVLLMGYRALPKSEAAAARVKGLFKSLKDDFVHIDIVPFDDLPEVEKLKDRVIIEASGEIVS